MDGTYHSCFSKIIFCLSLGAASKAVKAAQRGTVLDYNLDSIYDEISALGKPLAFSL